ncbi:MAG: hypothetical protein NT115_12410 [Proteobacteria bacterium]|nr:hypothetical protein [Pseudomonadota bacterium]
MTSKKIHAAGNRFGQRLGYALEGHVHHVDTGLRLEQLDGKV